MSVTVVQNESLPFTRVFRTSVIFCRKSSCFCELLRWPNTVFARALQSSLLMRGSARTMITKMKHGADKAMIYLFYAVPACDIIILKMTQCVICFSLLFVWNVRKS